MASYARRWERFEQAGLQVAGISVDSVEQNRAMVEKLLLTFPLLSDPEARVIREWGVFNEAEGGIAKPAAFVVRPDRSIAYEFVGGDFEERPEDEAIFEAAGAVA